MSNFLDKTIDEWDNIAEQWHSNEFIDMPLEDYMGLNEVEYAKYVHNITDVNLSDEEVLEEAGRRTREAVAGLMILELLSR